MSTSAESPQPETDIRPGEVRTYRGRTVEELIPQIRAELGPGAMILRERQGLTGGVGGFFAKRCVEIDAQSAPRLSVYADDEEADAPLEDEAQAPTVAPTPDPFAGFAARLEQAASEAFATGGMPDPFAGLTPPVPAAPVSAPAPVAPPAAAAVESPEAAPAPVAPEAGPADGFIAFEELGSEPAAVHTDATDAAGPTDATDTPDAEPALAAEPVALTVPILLDVAPANGSVFRPRPIEAEEPEQPSTFRSVAAAAEPSPSAADDILSTGTVTLRNRLSTRGLSAALSDQLIQRACDAAGVPEEPMLSVATQAALAALLPDARPLPVDGGVVAVVGAAASGKTRAVAALASAAARAGHSVTVARLAGADRDDELSELLEGESVELIPIMKTKATIRAVEAAREEDLVILDTPSTVPGADVACEELRETLARFAPDVVLLCAPATFNQPALTRLAGHHAPLAIGGLIATHADQAGMLGTVAELSIDSRIPLGHVHAGLEVADAISSVDPGRLAADLLR